MSGTIGFTVSTQLGSSISNLGRASNAIARVERSTVKASRAGRTMGQQVQQLSMAVGRAGGPLGQMSRLLGGGMGMAGGFGKVAAAIGVATIAFRMYRAGQERAIRATREHIRLERQRADAIRQGAQAHGASAAAGLSNVEATRRFVAQGGDVADARADAVRAGVGTHEMAAHFGSFMHRTGRAPTRTEIEAAHMMRETGIGSFDEAMTKIAGSRSVQAAPTASEMVARAARGDGRRLTATDVSQQHFRAQMNEPLMAVQMADEERARAENRRSTLAAQGGAMTQLRADTASTMDPVGTIMQENNRLAMQQLEELRRIASMESGMLRVWDDLWSRVGRGEGSHRTKYERAARNLGIGGDD